MSDYACAVGETRTGRRAIVLVIDACGVGALPDAAEYGDEGANTLAHVAQELGGLELPVMQSLGLGSILPLPGVPPATRPAIHGRLHALGAGKDSTSGHWELMGAPLAEAMPSYPRGLPPALFARLAQEIGHALICNQAGNGIAAIERFGAEHLRSGALILYTSASDSVVQIAAHVDRLPERELHAACAAARSVLTGEHAVGRVIARPFQGAPGSFDRTAGRRDFALAPPTRTHLQELGDRGVGVHGVGKVGDLFAGVGLRECRPGASNEAALASAGELLDELREGLIFVNLIETDQVYGHRKDVAGFHEALQRIDATLGRWLPRLRAEDLLVITADHGVDPRHPSGDHTREHVPLLALTGAMRDGAGARRVGMRHDGPLADVGASALWWLTGERAADLPGQPFLAGRVTEAQPHA